MQFEKNEDWMNEPIFNSSFDRYADYFRRKYNEGTTPLLDAESLRIIKDRNKHQSSASKETVGAYLGIVDLYPEIVGGLGPSCTPRRKIAARRVWPKTYQRGVVQEHHRPGH